MAFFTGYTNEKGHKEQAKRTGKKKAYPRSRALQTGRGMKIRKDTMLKLLFTFTSDSAGSTTADWVILLGGMTALGFAVIANLA